MAYRVAKLYGADNGTQYLVHIPANWVGQGHANNWSDNPVGGEPALPLGVKMRRQHLYNAASGRRRQLPFWSSNPGYFPNIGGSATLDNIDGTQTTYTVVAYSGERWQPQTRKRRP